MYTSLCIARVFDDHRSCQKLINYITNIKAKSKRYHWILKIPVLKRLFIQTFVSGVDVEKKIPYSCVYEKKNNNNEIMKKKNSPQVCK